MINVNVVRSLSLAPYPAKTYSSTHLLLSSTSKTTVRRTTDQSQPIIHPNKQIKGSTTANLTKQRAMARKIANFVYGPKDGRLTDAKSAPNRAKPFGIRQSGPDVGNLQLYDDSIAVYCTVMIVMTDER